MVTRNSAILAWPWLFLVQFGCNGGTPAPDTILYSTAPIAGAPHTCTIYANQMWQSAGLEIHKGDSVFIDANGRWGVPPTWPMTGPNGYSSWWGPTERVVCPDEPVGKLCGRIGAGRGFGVGQQLLIRDAEADGVLYLTFNDAPGWFVDNMGQMTVTVIIDRTRTVSSGAPVITCDLRIIAVSDGSGHASASGKSASDELERLAMSLANRLRDGVPVKGESIAVVSLRNRSGIALGRAVADELADKVQGALIDTGWFNVKERIDLRGVLNEQDLDAVGIIKNQDVRKRLAGVKYVVIGGITVLGTK